MSEDFAKRMAALDAAEELLSSTSIHGIGAGFRTQMTINRLILDAAQTCLEQGTGPENAEPGATPDAGA